jgi:hypothetical protein
MLKFNSDKLLHLVLCTYARVSEEIIPSAIYIEYPDRIITFKRIFNVVNTFE